jgi:type VI secretion system protein VasD
MGLSIHVILPGVPLPEFQRIAMTARTSIRCRLAFLPEIGRVVAAGNAGIRNGSAGLRTLFIIAGLVLGGCSFFASKPPPPGAPDPATSVSFTISASDNINQGALRRASPVVLRVYDLKSGALFQTADFLSLFERDREALGADLVGKEEFVVQPGTTKVLAKRPPGAEATVIGVVAAFQSLESAHWRATVTIKPGVPNAVSIGLDGSSLTVSSRP